ncbi:hypothetical protein Pan44_03950 [Caulifigura coniformis]|uniref:Resolvase/invertase-type recombinase catalytic domain-containing protein n=1 Tax=Caulifigura coniformis TaxID=2527983 RepID=A0A517S8D1_9PLAN|nr:recombinase family protein [Caulifigura coniformis]QDT52385.1 hypothetical protein Pan44_03950 [Caulifigura coniformis]
MAVYLYVPTTTEHLYTSKEVEDRKLEELRAHLLKVGATATAVYFDRVGCDTPPESRPGFSALLPLLRRGDFLVVVSWSCLGTPADITRLSRLMHQCGVALAVCREGGDEVDKPDVASGPQMAVGDFATINGQLGIVTQLGPLVLGGARDSAAIWFGDVNGGEPIVFTVPAEYLTKSDRPITYQH